MVKGAWNLKELVTGVLFVFRVEAASKRYPIEGVRLLCVYAAMFRVNRLSTHPIWNPNLT